MLEIREVGREVARPLVLRFHYSQRMPLAKHSFGLYIDGRLAGCCIYNLGSNRNMARFLFGEEGRQRDALELARLVIVPGVARKNLASQLIAGSARLLPPGKMLLSYADSNWSHAGYIYQAANWVYLGEGAGHIHRLVFDGKEIHHRTLLAKGGVDERRLERRRQLPKHRYGYASGDRRSRKPLLRLLRARAQPYPKLDPRPYEVADEAGGLI